MTGCDISWGYRFVTVVTIISDIGGSQVNIGDHHARPRTAKMNQDQPETLSVPAAGKRYFGLGKNGSYEAAKRGEIPTIKIGSRLRVPIIALDRMLAEAGSGRVTTSSNESTAPT
jgi:hypothetical protein